MLVVALALLLLFVALVAVVATRPAEFRIERSATMAAPPEAVFAQVDDFHRWQDWSPWAKLDPAMEQRYEGPSAGKGAVYLWNGDKKAGEGRMEILESDPFRIIRIDLRFVRPFPAQNVSAFDFAPEGGGTRVVWSMTGTNGFMAKAFGLFMDMDRMVGPDFEKGLAALAVAAESTAPVAV